MKNDFNSNTISIYKGSENLCNPYQISVDKMKAVFFFVLAVSVTNVTCFIGDLKELLESISDEVKEKATTVR